MRFLRKSLMGLFLLASTLALFGLAAMMVRSALEAKDDGGRRGDGVVNAYSRLTSYLLRPGRKPQFCRCLAKCKAKEASTFARRLAVQ